MTRPSPKPAAIAVAWQATERIPRGWTAWLARLLAGYASALGHPGAAVNLLVADDAELQRLNARYRRRNRPTDILSFSYLDAEHPVPARSARKPQPAPVRRAAQAVPPLVLGDLAVSWERVRAQAQANGWDARTEMARLLAHGCVHLLGYNHPTPQADAVMRRIEERLLEKAGFGGVYPQGRA